MYHQETSVPVSRVPRLEDFVSKFGALLDGSPTEAEILGVGAALLKDLIAVDDWLPEPFTVADPAAYRQYLLHGDSHDRFSVVSFVWGPGQSTPIHNHTVWGLVGMLRGAEISQSYYLDERQRPVRGKRTQLLPGDIELISPSIGDIHSVHNAFDDQTSISIHVYGADIGSVRRQSFDEDGGVHNFVSGYSNDRLTDV